MLNILPAMRQAVEETGIEVVYRGTIQLTYAASDINNVFNIANGFLGPAADDRIVVLCTNRQLFDAELDNQQPIDGAWAFADLSATVSANVIAFSCPSVQTPDVYCELPSSATTTLEVAVYTVTGCGVEPLFMTTSGGTGSGTSRAITIGSKAGGATIACAGLTTPGTTTTWTNLAEDTDLNSSTGRLTTASGDEQTFSASRTITAAFSGAAQNNAMAQLQFMPDTAVRWSNLTTGGNELVYTAQTSRSTTCFVDRGISIFNKVIYCFVAYELDVAPSAVTLGGIAGTLVGSAAINTSATPDVRVYMYKWGPFDGVVDGSNNLTVAFAAAQTNRVIVLPFVIVNDIQDAFDHAQANSNSTIVAASVDVFQDGDIILACAVAPASGSSATWTSPGLVFEEIMDQAVSTTYRITAAVCRCAAAAVNQTVTCTFSASGQNTIQVISIARQ